MGYFPPKRRRQREARLKHALRAGDPGAVVLTGRAEPYREWRYVRLAVPAWHWDTGVGQGIFTIAGIVQARMRLDDKQQLELERALNWFNRKLPVPDIDERDAIFWFKHSANECKRRVFRLAKTLKSLGIAVEASVTVEPGTIVYRDEFQIAAIPAPPSDAAEISRVFVEPE
ncbi:MAG TPA: hypothetical protein VIA18_25425 [Polyangia bacterium]|nr:hypothetical protein [Polyangia bacterium]